VSRRRNRRPVPPALLAQITRRHTNLMDRHLWTGSRWVAYPNVTEADLQEHREYVAAFLAAAAVRRSAAAARRAAARLNPENDPAS
jgi:hypothetical protein